MNIFRWWSKRAAPKSAAAKLKPVIDKIFPFEAGRDAFAYLESGAHFGKVVVGVGRGKALEKLRYFFSASLRAVQPFSNSSKS